VSGAPTGEDRAAQRQPGDRTEPPPPRRSDPEPPGMGEDGSFGTDGTGTALETLTHGATGYLLARAGLGRPAGRCGSILMTACALAPDVDFVLYFRGLDAYVRHHRGWTHSVLAWALVALAAAAVARRWAPRTPLWRLACMAYAAFLSHLLLDLATSYGTMAFVPLSDARYAWDFLFILDPGYIALAWAFSAAAWALGDRGRKAAVVGVAVLAAYLSVCALCHRAAEARVRTFAAGVTARPDSAEALPAPWTFLDWTGFVRAGDDTWVRPFRLLSAEAGGVSRYTEPPAGQLPPGVEDLQIVRLFRWFARYPHVAVTPGRDETVVEYSDLRFAAFRKRTPFVLRLRMDAGGRLRSWDVVTKRE
jgi:inner membrane protein